VSEKDVSEKEHVSEKVHVSEREHKALETVKHYMWFSMGAGLIPIPFLDLATVTGVQLKMLDALSKIYEVPFQANIGKAVIGSVIGSIVPGAISFGAFGAALKAVPVVGALAGVPVMVVSCGATAWALGRVFIQHFESGGTFLNLDPEQVREHFKTHLEEGRTVASTMKKDKSGLPA
jgi:uncharacterized protein (DUF697 family)